MKLDIKENKLTVWLADLGHNETARVRIIPLGIGYLASALQEMFGDRVEIRLFAFPDEILAELELQQPDVLAVSNYIWNHNVSLQLLRLTKERHSNVLTVMGGPHVRDDEDGLRLFIQDHPFIDVYVPHEAETSLCSLIRHCLSGGTELTRLGTVPGCFLNLSDYSYEPTQGKWAINEYGSPYLNGLLDRFLEDDRFFPLIESNRGCPYSCTFCAWGSAVGNKIVKKDANVNQEEAEYIAQRSSQDIWYFADGNFGIFEDDLEFAHKLKELSEIYGHPKKLNFNTAKNNAERVLKISQILGNMTYTNIAVQSLDDLVLKDIKRVNLNNNDIQHFIDLHHGEGRPVFTDLLYPCSGETLESHINSIRACVDLGFDVINVGQIRMLPGTQIETDESRRAYGLRTKWRPMDIGWGFYGDQFVFETDETIIATDTMTEDEVYGLKKLHFLMFLLWTYGFGKPLLTLGVNRGINPVDVMLALIEDEDSTLSREILTPLYHSFKEEFFDTEEELVGFYTRPEVAEAIVNGSSDFQKLTLKYVAYCLDQKDVIASAIDQMSEFIQQKTGLDPALIDVVAAMTKERLRLNFLPGDLAKRTHYTINASLFGTLKEMGLIDRSLSYEDDGFNLEYEFSEADDLVLKNLLFRFDYDRKPKVALYSALVTCDVAKFFTFGISLAESTDAVTSSKGAMLTHRNLIQ